MAAIRAEGSDSKRELFHDVVDEVDGIGLRVALVDLECPNSRRVIDGRVLVAPYGRSLHPFQGPSAAGFLTLNETIRRIGKQAAFSAPPILGVLTSSPQTRYIGPVPGISIDGIGEIENAVVAEPPETTHIG